tara:strand:- start:1112 stop:1837 length:726 start_codon:yes stop_codon:yes gene_type:complete
MLIIEFLGPPGSGKTYFKKKLISKYFRFFKVFDYRSINLYEDKKNFFIKIYFYLIKNTFVNKIKKIFGLNNYKINFLSYFFKEYNKNTNKLINHKKNYDKYKKIKNLINKSNFTISEKKLFYKWAKEEIAGSNFAKNSRMKNAILIESEGLIQRLFIYCFKKKNKKKIIKSYLNTIFLPKILIIFKKVYVNKKNRIKIDQKEINETIKIIELELKKRKILIIKSSEKIEETYKKISNLLKI